MLEAAHKDQQVAISGRLARKLFALLAFEMTKRSNFAGLDDQAAVESFLDKVWTARRGDLAGDLTGRDQFDAKLGALGALNEMIDPGVLEVSAEGPELPQIVWRNRTLQAMFSALWITRYATKDDRKWLRRHVFIRADDDTQSQYEMWKLAAEMPAKARRDGAYARTMSVLYLPHRQPERSLRSTEIIYRSWPTMLQLAGYLTKPNWLEGDVEAATQHAQQESRALVESGEDCRDRQNPARHAILRFLGEFPALVKGARGDDAQRIAAEFDEGFRRIPPNDGDSLEFWVSAERQLYRTGSRTQRSLIYTGFKLSQYPVTNELYALFDANHSGPGKERCPAATVDWYDAWCAASWLGGRLPTEHEWEYACRAQPGTDVEPMLWWCGDDWRDLETSAWYVENSCATEFDCRPHHVGADGHANRFGLYDMHGLVREWTSSWHHNNAEAGRDPTYVGVGRVVRGGGFKSSSEWLYSAAREGESPDRSNDSIGFRVARGIQ